MAKQNPKAAARAADDKINALYHRHCNGVPIPMMQIPDVFKVGREALAAGESDWEVARKIVAFIDTIRTDGKKSDPLPAEPARGTKDEHPLVRNMRAIANEHQWRYLDNLTGEHVPEPKANRARKRAGLVPNLCDEFEETATESGDTVLLAQRKGKTINPVMVDMTTASVFIQVHDKLSPESRQKWLGLLESRGMSGVVDLMWKLVKRAEAAAGSGTR